MCHTIFRLTAFVIKVFCQATELIHIDDDVVCSGVKWLIKNQEPDGSYVEKHPMYHVDMMVFLLFYLISFVMY